MREVAGCERGAPATSVADNSLLPALCISPPVAEGVVELEELRVRLERVADHVLEHRVAEQVAELAILSTCRDSGIKVICC